MDAVVKWGRGHKQVELRDMPEPELGPGEVLLAPRAVGVCGSDIEMWHDGCPWVINTPVIQGHEFCGEIVAVGEGVTDYAVGDHCVSETAARVCGRCRACRTGFYNLCPDRLGYGYGTHGAFTRLVRVPERCLHRLPADMAWEHAALCEPAAVAYNALVVRSEVRPGEPVVVIGPGPIGLFCVQMARLQGAWPIAVVGLPADAHRLDKALEIGATHRYYPDEAVAGLRAQTGGFGAPLVVDCAGAPAAMRLAMEILSPLGQITKLAWTRRAYELDLDALVQRAGTIGTSFSHTWRTWEAVLKLIEGGRLDMAAMVTHQFPLADWLTAFETVEAGTAIKAVIRP